MPLFQNSVLNKYLKEQDKEAVQSAYDKYRSYFHNPDIQRNILDAKEEQFQEGFLRELFVRVFCYVLNPRPDYNLTTEYKNEKGAKKADGAMLKDGKAIGVIELKSTKTKDLESIRQQAFDYKANHTGCVYVITSNFQKLRFYINDAVEFEEFDLFILSPERFEMLYLCLSSGNILANLPQKIKKDSLLEEEKITKKFYADYSLFKKELFESMVDLNLEKAEMTKLLLYKKTQKLLDRFLFIFFAEDRGLLPPNSISRMIRRWHILKDEDAYKPLYEIFKQYFGYLNTGRKGKIPGDDIHEYNGGLFLPDPLLDKLEIDDDVLLRHTSRLTTYDFDSNVDVNILGHIFEHSLNEIESTTAELEGVDFDKQKSKRKKDGVFYTPKYITKYIVDNTVGKLCDEKKTVLGIREDEFTPGRQKGTKRKLLTALENYRSWLLELTICDPACGSGAFLNQALEFLINEHHFIDELNANLFGSTMLFQDVENEILEKNLYGVDINEESVEIARLSLWLRTAQRGRKLTTLNKNIKCGNSLIDDPAVAGDKAFKWEEEFPEVFHRKEKKAWHLTWVTHDTRTSQRMTEYRKPATGEIPVDRSVILDEKDELLVTRFIGDIVKDDKLNVVAYNICNDHVHLLLVCTADELSNTMRKLKGKSAQNYKEHLGLPREDQFHLWAQKYNKREITGNAQLENTIAYIRNNREKHGLPANEGLQPLVEEMTCAPGHAFRQEYAGGFDVVIGNPPYVRQELLGEIKPYLEENYNVFEGTTDLFSYFYERSFLILKRKGFFGFISNTFDKTKAAIKLRDYLQSNIKIINYVDFTEVQIFEGATTYPVIIIAQKIYQSEILFSYTKIPKSSQSKIINIDSEVSVDVSQKTLESESWSFNSIQQFGVLEKIKNFKSIRDKFGKCFRGIVTGFNDAFIIDRFTKETLENEEQSSKELIKPFYEGKDLCKWRTAKIEKYLIFTRRGTNIDQYPAIKRYLEVNKERLTPRNSPEIKIGRKPGPYKWFEIQDSVDYYKVFEDEKITWPNLQSANKFCLESNQFYINAPSVVFPTNNKTLLCILNSKLTWFFLKSICVIRSGGYIEVKPQYFEQIPVPELRNEQQFEKASDTVMRSAKELQRTLEKFRQMLIGEFQIGKLSKKLKDWDNLSWSDFEKELKKQKIVLFGMQKDDWFDRFSRMSEKVKNLKTEIITNERNIDQMVYELYGLTEEEIRIVEESTNIKNGRKKIQEV